MSDLISRQAAIETVKKHYRGFDNDLLEIIAYEMEELPPTQLAQDLSNGCTDTISRAAALNLIEQSCCDLEYACDNVALRKEAKELPPVTPKQPGWIPCDRELPKPNEKDGNGFYKAYLVQDGRWMDVARWDGKYWVAWGYSTVLLNVVAWCELPKPWEGGQNDGKN